MTPTNWGNGLEPTVGPWAPAAAGTADQQGGTTRRWQPPRRTDLGAAFADVLAAAQANAGWAYQRLFDAHGRLVAAYLKSQGAADPDDLANEVFLRAFRNLATFSGDEAGFRSWLYVIARNCLIDEHRRHQRRPVLVAAEVDLPTPAAADQEALAHLGTERVHELLAGLSPDQRDVLLLRVVADLTVDQVASVLGKQPGAIKQLQRRGLDNLRRRMRAEDEA